MSSTVSERSGSSMRVAQSAGRPEAAMPARQASAMATQESCAAVPPLSTQALPERSVRQMASAVTLGRAS